MQRSLEPQDDEPSVPSLTERAVMLVPVVTVAAQGSLAIFGTIGFAWAVVTGDGFWRFTFSVLALLLAAITPRISQIEYDIVNGRVKARTRKG